MRGTRSHAERRDRECVCLCVCAMLYVRAVQIPSNPTKYERQISCRIFTDAVQQPNAHRDRAEGFVKASDVASNCLCSSDATEADSDSSSCASG